MEDKVYALDDSVLARIVQILQEGIILGDDVTDLMRQIRLAPSPEKDGVLIMTPEYRALVNQMHDKLLEHAKALRDQAAATGQKTIFEA